MSDNKDDQRKKGLNAEDEDLWAAMTNDVEPLKGRERPLAREDRAEDDAEVVQEKPTRKVRVTTAKSETRPAKLQSREVDASTMDRLKSGKIRPEGRLDLHGFNQGQARVALIDFIQKAQASGKRCVLVVTGKGQTGRSSEDWLDHKPGVLKQNVPGWLYERELGSIVLKAVPAQPKDGGSGALYVYLRRNRDLTPPPEPYV